jgi:hypothetical protein
MKKTDALQINNENLTRQRGNHKKQRAHEKDLDDDNRQKGL